MHFLTYKRPIVNSVTPNQVGFMPKSSASSLNRPPLPIQGIKIAYL